MSPSELAGREHLNLLPIDIAIEQEVETLERPADRQSAVFEPLFDTSLFAKGRLRFCQQFEKCPERELLAHTLLDELRQTFGGKVPTQAREQRAATIEPTRRLRAGHDSASTRRAYVP